MGNFKEISRIIFLLCPRREVSFLRLCRNRKNILNCPFLVGYVIVDGQDTGKSAFGVNERYIVPLNDSFTGRELDHRFPLACQPGLHGICDTLPGLGMIVKIRNGEACGLLF